MITYVCVTKENEMVINQKTLELNGLTIELGLALMTATDKQLMSKYHCVPKFDLPEEVPVVEEEEDGSALDFHKPTMAEIIDEIYSVDDEGETGAVDGYSISDVEPLSFEEERARIRKQGGKAHKMTDEDMQDDLVNQWLKENDIAYSDWLAIIRCK